MRTYKTPKGTELPILDLRGKDYLQVAHRVVWFREERPLWTIETAIISHDDKKSVFRATISDENGRVIAQATKQEDTAGFRDHLEKSETGAIGRALALCGFGTQFTPELDEGERLADGPLPSPPKRPIAGTSPPPATGYVIGFGKFKGKPLGAVNVEDLKNYASWLLDEAQKKGKPLNDMGQEFIERVQAL